MPEYSIRNYSKLDQEQRHNVGKLLSYIDLPATPLTGGVESTGMFGIGGGRYVALLKNGKPIAAIATDASGLVVHNWVGMPDREFVKEHGTSPAQALMLHLLRRNGGTVKYSGRMGGMAANMFDKQLLSMGVSPPAFKTRNSDVRTITVPKKILERLQLPKIKILPWTWRYYRPK
ncbi:hypothetical protein COU36_03625 [Candidatus Micrarchaeota archaeon CG10_big_fil_rev_8_21_14_0_10_59_7]|nr:MAG: hypothetical protein COU36_03625 [Candidatus Micrarchaeota archaeon CG10_big_fil_rev_8_21_14_0_10_59_7]